jgi:hypothetical protein
MYEVPEYRNLIAFRRSNPDCWLTVRIMTHFIFMPIANRLLGVSWENIKLLSVREHHIDLACWHLYVMAGYRYKNDDGAAHTAAFTTGEPLLYLLSSIQVTITPYICMLQIQTWIIGLHRRAYSIETKSAPPLEEPCTLLGVLTSGDIHLYSAAGAVYAIWTDTAANQLNRQILMHEALCVVLFDEACRGAQLSQLLNTCITSGCKLVIKWRKMFRKGLFAANFHKQSPCSNS